MRTFGTATLKGSTWHIEADPHVAMRMKRLFKRSDRGNPGKLTLSHSAEVCADLEWFCSRYPLEVKPSPEALSVPAREFHETILRLEEYLSDSYEPRPFDMELPPRSYQAREAEIVLTQRYLLIADEVGLGKTCASLAVLSDPRTRPAVVVCPTHLPRQWAHEAKKFLPGAHVHVISKGTPYPIEAGLFGAPDIYVVNYAKMPGWAKVLATRAKTVIFDEIQALRTGSGTQKYDAATYLAAQCEYRVGLSATPIYNYGGEIFNILQILKPGLLGTFTEFVSEWCSYALGNGRARYKLREPRAFGTWARETFAIVRHTRSEVGRELPDVVKIVQTVDSDPAALDAVEDRAAELARIILSGSKLERGAKMMAAEELSNAVRQATGISKAPYVAEFVRLLVESGEAVVLCGWHHAVYSIWEDKLRDLGVVKFTGEQNAAQKEQAKQRFVKGDAKVMLLSLRSGEGLNDLQLASSCIVFGELDWSPGIHEQCLGRLQRDGQKNKVVAYFLTAEGGSDPLMIDVLGVKREQVEGIRDPAGDLVERLESGEDRIRKLAELYLKKRGETPDRVELQEATG